MYNYILYHDLQLIEFTDGEYLNEIKRSLKNKQVAKVARFFNYQLSWQEFEKLYVEMLREKFELDFKTVYKGENND